MKKIINYFTFLVAFLFVLFSYNNNVFADTCEYCGMKALGNSTSDKYKLYYNTVGGSKYDMTLIGKDDLPVLRTPTKDGYNFNGWYIGLTKYDFNEKLEGDTIVRAGFSKICTVKFLNEENTEPVVEEFVCGMAPNEYEPLKEGYVFKGWITSDGDEYTGGELYFDDILKPNFEKATDEDKDYDLVAPVIKETSSIVNENAVIENGLKWATSRVFSIDFQNDKITKDINFYFKSTSSALSNADVYECDDSLNKCKDFKVVNIEPNKWYRTTSRVMSLTYEKEATIQAMVEYNDKKSIASAEVKYVDGIKPTIPTLKVTEESYDGKEYTSGTWTKSSLYFTAISMDSESKIDHYEYSTGYKWYEVPDEWRRIYNVDKTQVKFVIFWSIDAEFYIRSVDKAGNVSEKIVEKPSKILRIDVDAPIMSDVSVREGSFEGDYHQDGTISNQGLYFQLTASDTNVVSGFEYSKNGKDWHLIDDSTFTTREISGLNSKKAKLKFSIDENYTGGLWIRAIDGVKNASDMEQVHFNLNINKEEKDESMINAPTLIATTVNEYGTSYQSGQTTASSVYIKAQSETKVSKWQISYDGVNYQEVPSSIKTSISPKDESYYIYIRVIEEGTHNIYIRTVDSNNKVSKASYIKVIIDKSNEESTIAPPTLTSTKINEFGSTYLSGTWTPYSVYIKAESSIATSNWQYSYDGVNYQAIPNDNGSILYRTSMSPKVGTASSYVYIGIKSKDTIFDKDVYIRNVDSNGNASKASRITVRIDKNNQAGNIDNPEIKAQEGTYNRVDNFCESPCSTESYLYFTVTFAKPVKAYQYKDNAKYKTWGEMPSRNKPTLSEDGKTLKFKIERDEDIRLAIRGVYEDGTYTEETHYSLTIIQTDSREDPSTDGSVVRDTNNIGQAVITHSSGSSNYAYNNGNNVHANVVITYNGKVLSDGVDYVLDYLKYNANITQPGVKTVQVNGIGAFEGTYNEFTYTILNPDGSGSSSSGGSSSSSNTGGSSTGGVTSNEQTACYYADSYDESNDKLTCIKFKSDVLGWIDNGSQICYYANKNDELNNVQTCINKVKSVMRTVTFKTSGTFFGDTTSKVKVFSKVNRPTDPIKDGSLDGWFQYEFVGWYLLGTDKLYDFNSDVIVDITLYSVWRFYDGDGNEKIISDKDL